jgi:hypothetical protein
MKTKILVALLFFLGLFYSSVTNALYYYESCSSTYGRASINSWIWKCGCLSGYHFETKYWRTTCVKDLTCQDLYWVMAMSNYDGTCSCFSWYVFQTDIFWKTSCENWNIVCHKQLWYNSSYNSYSKMCECDNWYTIQDWTCKEKSISAYFFLSSYDYDNDEVVVYDYYTKKWYKLELKWTAGLSKTENFVDWLIAINMWTDGKLNRWDYFVLNSDKKTKFNF